MNLEMEEPKWRPSPVWTAPGCKQYVVTPVPKKAEIEDI